ncbi:type II toxin-antitoxin system HicA family toxin [bacterium]|nr:MAG: type II toxin-antitoxin system HicA family toxin [bacterium]
MSKVEKLIQKLKNYPKDFTYEELRKILFHFGYEEIKTGKTSGSRVAFYREESQHIIRLHKPHPKPILKEYQIQMLIKELSNQKLLL